MHAGCTLPSRSNQGAQTHKTGHRRAPGRPALRRSHRLQARTRAFYFKSLPRTPTHAGERDPSSERRSSGEPEPGRRVGENGKEDPSPGKGAGPPANRSYLNPGLGPRPRGTAGRVDRSDPGPAAACPTAAQASAPRSAAPRHPATPRPTPPTQSPPAAATASPQLARVPPPPPPPPPRPARSRTPRARLPAPLPDGAAPGVSWGGAGSARARQGA